MPDKIVGKIDKIPKESRLNEYLKTMVTLFESFDADKFEEFLKKVFHDCVDFLVATGTQIPTTRIMFVYNSDQYVNMEKQCTLTAISKEIAKGPSTAFVIRRATLNKIYVNVGYLIENINLGYPSFILNLVNAYTHEILHIAFPNKSEQEIHDLEFETVEKFLGINLPIEFKRLKASDYYRRRE